MRVLVTVSAYSGPPPLNVVRALTAWHFGVASVVVVVVGVAYLVGVRCLGARGSTWPAARSYSFVVGGMGSLLLVTSGFVGVYADTLFWVRAVQNVTLLMVSPMLCAMGAPLTLLREFLPGRLRSALGRALRSRTARSLTYPLVITPVFVAPLPIVYLSPLYSATLTHTWVGALVEVGLLGCGWLYFWTRFRVDPTPRRDPYLVSLGISVAEVVFDGALGLWVWLGPLLAAGYYEALARPWGPSLRIDQIVGAGVLWIGGDLAGLPFLAVVLRRLSSEDAHEAELVDAALDRQEELADARSTQQAPDGPDERPRLWWEDHPELAARFRPR